MTRLYGARGLDARPVRIGAPYPLVGASAPSSDLRQWSAPVVDQDGQSCVGQAIRDAHSIAVRAQGKRLSAYGVYTAARVREQAAVGAPLPDIGCQPADAFDALVSTGAFAEDAYSADPAHLNMRETWGEAEASRLFRPEWLTPIAGGDLASVDGWLSSGFPVFFAISVDAAFEQLSGTTVWNGLSGPVLGGHAMAIVGHTPSAYLVQNSWGAGWGSGGFGFIARATIQSAARCLVAVGGGPIL